MPLKKDNLNKTLRDLSNLDLKQKIKEDEIKLVKLKFSHTISPLENPKQITELRRNLARAKTETNLRLKQSK